MTRYLSHGTVAGLLLALATPATASERTFVSASGKDAWSCTEARPCRTVGRAVSMTDPGGAVLILDSGVFSETTVMIGTGITIEAAPGALAELTAPSYAAISVNAGMAEIVVLDNLVLRGQGSGPNSGIVYNSAAELHVRSCVIRGFPTYGIGTYGGAKRLVVTDTLIRDNYVGLSLYGATGADVMLTHVTLAGNGVGAGVFGGSATVVESLATGNTQAGFLVDACGEDVEATFERCTASGNGTGVMVRSNVCGPPAVATARISGCTVTGNTTGAYVDAASTLASRGNNTIAGNATDVSGVITALAPI